MPPVQLPPNMLREIYNLTNRRTQAKMHVLNTSTRDNQFMPQRSRSYLTGDGKHQKLWNRVPKALKALHQQYGALSEYSNIWYHVNWPRPPVVYSRFLDSMISMYKKTRQSNKVTQIVDVTAAITDALSLLKSYEVNLMHKTVHVAFEFRESIPQPRMDLELLMDATLVFSNNKLQSLRRASNRAVAAAVANAPNRPNNTRLPSAARARRHAKAERAEVYQLPRNGSARNARIARRANRRAAR